MSPAAGGHPSDAERERDSAPVLRALLDAARARDRDALAACYDGDAAWLDASGTVRGAPAAAERHAAVAARADRWSDPQQLGAKAVLRWRRDGAGGEAEDGGALVVEVRRGRVVFAAAC